MELGASSSRSARRSVGSLFSSDAWNNVTFAAAEVKNPQKNLPRALLLGTGLVSALYILANVGYLSVLPLHGAADGATVIARGIDHATQDRVATAVMEYIFGANGAAIMAGAILISTFGCNNGLILSGARVYYAMARDGLFFQKAGELSKNSVPAFALIAQSVWTSLLCLTGTYNQLLDYVIFAALLFYALTTIGLFILRVKRPDEPRPYRAVGYPVLPALYILFASGIAITLLVADKTRVQALSGLALVVLGVPVYYLWRREPRPGRPTRRRPPLLPSFHAYNMTQTQSSLFTSSSSSARARSRSLFAVFLARWVLARPTGTPEMRKISDAIQEGAEAYLARQYKTISMLVGRRGRAARRRVRFLPPHHAERSRPGSQDVRDLRHGVLPARRAQLGRRRLRRHVGLDPHEHPRRRGGDDVAQRRAADGAARWRGVRPVHGRDVRCSASVACSRCCRCSRQPAGPANGPRRSPS